MKKVFFIGLSAIAALTMMVSCDKTGTETPEDNKANPSKVAASNLVAYFSFDGNANEGIASITPKTETGVTYVAGRRGKCLQGADNGYILYDLPATSKIRTLKGFALAMWFKNEQIPAEVAPTPMIFQVTNDNDLFWGNISLCMDRSGSAEAPSEELNMKTTFRKDGVDWANQFVGFTNAAYQANRWFHVIYQYDNVASAYNVYVNGIKITTDEGIINRLQCADGPAFGDLNFVAPSQLVIGGWMPKIANGATDEWMGWFKGNMDEVRLYDRALTDTEAKELYDAEVENLNE